MIFLAGVAITGGVVYLTVRMYKGGKRVNSRRIKQTDLLSAFERAAKINQRGKS